MRKNIVLIGMMGCGKSTAGRELSRRLERLLVDTDRQIETQENCTIAELFEQRGEEYFRERELAVCRQLANQQGLIISCGGGLPMREECMLNLKHNGIVIWLQRDGNDIYENVNMTHRPLGQVSREEFLERCAQREPVYRRWADYIVQTGGTAEETLESILEAIK